MKKENKKHVVNESEIAHFNALREWAKNKTFTRTEIMDTLKDKYRPTMNQNLFQALISGVNPPIVRIERNKYAFAKEPVHITRLQVAWDLYASYGNKKKKSVDVHLVGAEKPHMHTLTPEEELQKAIALLKNHGYRILRKRIVWDDV